jgi:hypothetical protein
MIFAGVRPILAAKKKSYKTTKSVGLAKIGQISLSSKRAFKG